MTDEIRQYVLQLLLEKGPLPNSDDLDGYRYLDAGHIDSLGFIRFIFRIEDRFNIRFEPQDIGGAAIRTVVGLVKLIDGKVST